MRHLFVLTRLKVLGNAIPEIHVDTLGPVLHLGTYPKTLFSMLTPEVLAKLEEHKHIRSILLMGIEVSPHFGCYFGTQPASQSHICVLQTAVRLSHTSKSGQA